MLTEASTCCNAASMAAVEPGADGCVNGNENAEVVDWPPIAMATVGGPPQIRLPLIAPRCCWPACPVRSIALPTRSRRNQ